MKQQTVTGRAAMLVLPLPPIDLKVNRVVGRHWASLQQTRNGYRYQVIAAIREKGLPVIERYPIHLKATFYVGKGQQLPDLTDAGTWAKMAVDLVFPDDSPKFIKPFTVDCERDNANPRLELSW